MAHVLSPQSITDIVTRLQRGQIGILPTDTIYGIHCSALDKDLITKVADIKEQDRAKPFISIIGSINDLEKFDVIVDSKTAPHLERLWPGPNTLIFPTKTGDTVALRLPNNAFLRKIMQSTGPLVSTSTNKHTQPPSQDIITAQNYFGDAIDFYVDGGILNNPPSNIYRFENCTLVKLR